MFDTPQLSQTISSSAKTKQVGQVEEVPCECLTAVIRVIIDERDFEAVLQQPRVLLSEL